MKIRRYNLTFKYFVFFLVTAIVVASCSIGYMKDRETGLKLSYNGFAMEDVYMKIDNKKINSNKIPYGRRVFIEIEDLKDYHIFNGKASIGCEVTITDENGSQVMHSPDVFSFTDGGYDAELLNEITISMPALYPIEAGKTYHWEGRFWDKYSEATMNSEVDVEIIDSKEIFKNNYLAVNSDGVEYYAAFVETDYILLNNNEVNIDKELTLNVIDVEGFAKKDSLYEIDYYTSFKNIESGEEFEFYDTLTINELRNLYSNYKMGTAVKANEKYLWTSKFQDLNSETKIEATLEIKIVE